MIGTVAAAPVEALGEAGVTRMFRAGGNSLTGITEALHRWPVICRVQGAGQP